MRALPVAALGLEAEQEVALRRAGLKYVGDVLRLPIAAIVARFGAGAATALRRLTGAMDSPLAPRALVPALVVERRFAEPVASTFYAFATLEDMAVRGGGAARGAARAAGAGSRRSSSAPTVWRARCASRPAWRPATRRR